MSAKKKKTSKLCMQQEKNRLASFTHFPAHVSILASILAAAGFYHKRNTQINDDVICFSCGCHLSNWSSDDDHHERHKEVSPNCPLVRNHSVNSRVAGNVPFGSIPLVAQGSPGACGSETSSSEQHGSLLSPPSFGAASLYQTPRSPVSRSYADIPSPTSISGISAITTPHNPTNDLSSHTTGFYATSSLLGQQRAPETTSQRDQRLKRLKRESVRLETFTTWATDAPVDKHMIAKAGFYYIGPGDRVRCAFCYNVLRMWEEGDIPEREHKKYFPRCPFVSNALTCGNIPVEHDYDPLPPPSLIQPRLPSSSELPHTGSVSNRVTNTNSIGITMNRSDKPHLARVQMRRHTFSSWPHEAPMDPEQLIEAGFYYSGRGDMTSCFHCKLTLRLWKADDNIWEEHARWNPKCQFVIMNKGEAFINEVKLKYAVAQSMASATQEPSGQSSDPLINRRKLYEIMTSDLVRQAVNQGYSKKAISKLMERRINENLEPIRDLAGLIGELSGQCDTSEHARVMSGSGGREPSGSYTHNETHSITDPVGLYVTTSSQRVRVLSGSGSREPSGSHTPDETHVTDDQTSLLVENQQIEDAQICKICMETDINVVFLPCGHLVCCYNCASAVKLCPVCRQFIAGTVKIYKS